MSYSIREMKIVLTDAEWSHVDARAKKNDVDPEAVVSTAASKEIGRLIQFAAAVREDAGSLADGVPENWTRCPVCGLPARDGEATCGKPHCKNITEAGLPIEEGAERIGQLPAETNA